MDTLLDLPNELITQILSYLTHQDIIACQLSNKQLHTIIKDSVLLQFQIALSTFKATDNPSCQLSAAERFQALKDSEYAWTNLREDFKRRIGVNHEVSTIYDLSGGVFLLGDTSRAALHYIRLPSSVDDEVKWHKIQLGRGEGMIIDMAFCVYEHDMLAVITITPHYDGIQVVHAIRIIFFKVSTGEPHPAAKESTIHVFDSHWGRPTVSIEIVGDRLVLISTFHGTNETADDHVFVYEWRTAVLKMSFSAPDCSYSGLVFLSENLVLIPNALTNALEIWDIFSTQKTPHPSCILQLPELEGDNSLSSITCRGEPNPIGSGSRIQSDIPFIRSAREAIILFHIRVHLERPLRNFDGELVSHNTFTLVVHRNALCELYEQYCANMNGDLAESFGDSDLYVQAEDFGFEDSGLGEVIVDDDGSDGWESVESDSHIGDNMSTRATDNDPIPMPWHSWGSPITCLFLTDILATRWITTTAGQRCVVIVQFPIERVGHYVVLDFNPDNVRRAGSKLGYSYAGLGSHIRPLNHQNREDTEGVFKDPITSGLPFVARRSGEVRGWNGAMMDEDRVIGLMEESGGRIKVIEVHHFGGPQN